MDDASLSKYRRLIGQQVYYYKQGLYGNAIVSQGKLINLSYNDATKKLEGTVEKDNKFKIGKSRETFRITDLIPNVEYPSKLDAIPHASPSPCSNSINKFRYCDTLYIPLEIQTMKISDEVVWTQFTIDFDAPLIGKIKFIGARESTYGNDEIIAVVEFDHPTNHYPRYVKGAQPSQNIINVKDLMTLSKWMEANSHVESRPSVAIAGDKSTDEGKVLPLLQKPTDGNNTPNLGHAKLPLRIVMEDWKPVKIVAYTNWSIKRLKQEILRVCNLGDSGLSILKYKDRLLSNDESLLSTYKMDPDSLLHAKLQKSLQEIPDIGGLKIAKDPPSTIRLIGNCMALKNGTHEVYVKDINPGMLLLAKIDIDNLTVGDITTTCRVKGLGNVVYIGVKFRKQLALGSAGIRISHADVLEGHCDKCDGRKILYIPSNQIGNLKHHLFQIQ